ncbi:hypothetical protein AAJCM20276_13760 [Acetobacter aceti]|uniref:Uncharacterized protein n=1 Tax=Acetobacter aceti TaxID=435 RepID=A0A6S6PPY9_ACEAC|nr:hypothetical protein AAJCM20276_13760 [Acetobacter aceti]
MVAVASPVRAFAFAAASSCALLMAESDRDVLSVDVVLSDDTCASSFCSSDWEEALDVCNWAEFAGLFRDWELCGRLAVWRAI